MFGEDPQTLWGVPLGSLSRIRVPPPPPDSTTRRSPYYSSTRPSERPSNTQLIYRYPRVARELLVKLRGAPPAGGGSGGSGGYDRSPNSDVSFGVHFGYLRAILNLNGHAATSRVVHWSYSAVA